MTTFILQFRENNSSYFSTMDFLHCLYLPYICAVSSSFFVFIDAMTVLISETPTHFYLEILSDFSINHLLKLYFSLFIILCLFSGVCL